MQPSYAEWLIARALIMPSSANTCRPVGGAKRPIRVPCGLAPPASGACVTPTCY